MAPGLVISDQVGLGPGFHWRPHTRPLETLAKVHGARALSAFTAHAALPGSTGERGSGQPGVGKWGTGLLTPPYFLIHLLPPQPQPVLICSEGVWPRPGSHPVGPSPALSHEHSPAHVLGAKPPTPERQRLFLPPPEAPPTAGTLAEPGKGLSLSPKAVWMMCCLSILPGKMGRHLSPHKVMLRSK